MGSWKKEFLAREFRLTFPSPNPHKVLHDLVKKGLLEKISWGRYRVNSPKEYLKQRFSVRDAYNLVRAAKLEYAFTDPDAVFFWTKGGYNIDRFFAFYPIHLKVKKRELRKWRSFFKSRGSRVHVNGESVKQTLFGTFYVLYPEEEFKTVDIEGFRVVPLKETVEFCENNIYAYEPALEMLNETYSLGLTVKYKEAETNL
ncbi:MAG: hypothetical protein ACE5I5_08665 [Candidatus Heimdallarchaeota archaeon]